jgi:hypothetical protein
VYQRGRFYKCFTHLSQPLRFVALPFPTPQYPETLGPLILTNASEAMASHQPLLHSRRLQRSHVTRRIRRKERRKR